jgi:CubicO group peptidase (beta-lactamase class C family)
VDLDVLEQALAAWDVPGLQVVVVAGGEVLHAGALGARGVDDPAPLTAGTLFDHGSCGKA